MVLSSAFQKSIRRNDTLALRCATRMNPNKLWEKLSVIAAEDIGRGDKNITSYLLSQYKKYKATNHKADQRAILLQTVNYFVQTNTSRIADNANHAFFKDIQPREGAEMSLAQLKKEFTKAIGNKNWDLAIRYAAHLFKKNQDGYMIYVLTRPKDMESSSIIHYYNLWTQRVRNKTDVLFLVNLILHRCLDYSSYPMKDINDIAPLTQKEIDDYYSDISVISFPDWVYDKHTRKGAELGRGFQHFYDVSAFLQNCFLDDPYESIARGNNCAKDL